MTTSIGALPQTFQRCPHRTRSLKNLSRCFRQSLFQGVQPNDWLRYEHGLSSSRRTKQLLRWLYRDDHAVDLSAFTKELGSVRIQWTGPLTGFDANLTGKPILLSRSIASRFTELRILGVSSCAIQPVAVPPGKPST